MSETKTATLVVMGSSSKCTCGLEADPDETHHNTAPADYYRRKACGAKFTAITTDSALLGQRWWDTLTGMRPDLPIVEYGTWKPLDGPESRPAS